LAIAPLPIILDPENEDRPCLEIAQQLQAAESGIESDNKSFNP
jgi:hypothetical protein